jgi:hypothetical protein
MSRWNRGKATHPRFPRSALDSAGLTCKFPHSRGALLYARHAAWERGVRCSFHGHSALVLFAASTAMSTNITPFIFSNRDLILPLLTSLYGVEP